jgi:protein TonB
LDPREGMSSTTKADDLAETGPAAGGRTRPLVARRDEPAVNAASDLGNVVPFAPPRRAAPEAPPIAVAAQDRAAAPTAPASAAKNLALVAGSLAVHCSILLVLWQSPPPMASIGIEPITVDVIWGGTSAAGLASSASGSTVPVTEPSPEDRPEDQSPDPAQLATTLPQEVPVAAQDTAPEQKDERPQETPSESDTQVAVVETPRVESSFALPPPTTSEPVEAVETEKPAPAVVTAEPAPERKRVAAPTAKKTVQKKRTAAAAPNAAGGVGVGQSNAAANYSGRVAGHLGRHKQYPTAARAAGSQGNASVSFSIDGGGRVTSVRLARSSGVGALDQEAVAMVRRASPFPAPPDGRGRSFTVPVRFNLR